MFDVDAGNEETSSACSSDSEDGQSTRGSDEGHAAFSGANKRKQETTDGWFSHSMQMMLVIQQSLNKTVKDVVKNVEICCICSSV